VSASFFAMVLEDQHVAHPLITLQIDDARYISSDYVTDLLDFKFVEATVVARRLGNDLMCPYAIHQIVEAFGAPSQFAFDS
jgi:hypothetical protein